VTGRIVRALVWLQWRMLVNRLTKSSHRDGLEQVSRWGEVALRVVMAALLLPAMALAALAAIVGGWLAARDAGDARTVAIVAGIAVLVPLVWMLLRPLAMLGSGGVERGVLLRLLPIPTRLLRNAEVVRAMAEPFFVLLAPAILLLPAGAAAAGSPLLAVAALVAGVLFLALAALVGNLVTLAGQLLLRGRRRAELVTLVVLVVLSTLGILPQIMLPHDRHHAERPPAAAAAPAPAPAPQAEDLVGMLRALPPAAYAATILDAANGRPGRTTLDVTLLAAWTVALYALTIPIYRRLITVPEGGSGRRAAAERERRLHLPFVAPATAAVATAELRALLRTVRGKMALFYPALMTIMLAVVFARGGGDMPKAFAGPLMLGAFAVFGSVAGIGVFACNMFALQGSGLILELLLPLGECRLAAGKAIAIGAVVAAGLLLALLPPAVLSPTTSPAIWLAMWIAGLAAYAAASPVAMVVSALLVKPIDLSRIGRAGQPHGLASLIYLLGTVAAAAPAAGLILLALHALNAPWAAPPLVLAYAVVAVLAARAVAPVTERVIASRRENLALVVAGR
jgi:hypothetical protein